MENVAHTLAGLLLAEIVVSSRAPTPRGGRFARLAYLVSGIANNLPDADQLYTAVTGGKLGYLLHHRGHTHTLPFALCLGLAVALITIALSKRKSGPLGTGDAARLIALGLAGGIVHITMDAWNVYGVHPFWPLYSGWLYGDAVFIVEPLFWLVGIPALYLAATRRWWRITLAVLFVSMLLLPWVASSFVPLEARLLLLVVAAASVLGAQRLSPRVRPRVAAVGFALIAIGFLFASSRARGIVTRAAGSDDSRIVDLALSSMPANPLCFSGQLLERTADDTLVATRLVVAPFPSFLPVSRCPVGESASTAPFEPTAKSGDVALLYRDTLRAPLAGLRELDQQNCEAHAALIFMRMPYWVVAREDKLVLGDLRFDRSTGFDFADLEIDRAPSVCPRFLPGWTPPRADILR